ncbi:MULTISPECIES: IclR family transcriptional regulator domain-containing protein [Streptomyces]|jgi:IclR family pca regulon transcriptional regulator|uniref:IclR-ED domain-containing protein n=1 Tax=Streptomyces spinosisporus TaxID=2927582 RepID=A0ABS9XUP4_9ACTN|nr:MULTISPECIES: IclR family transcriptional regulator C-terminal domain-containing protein [Streptomyces]MCI3245790.1 hypothetical protein [Streptomyces spinosisporus]WUB33476.1 hypothetical protein OHN38_00535 [Streptomyces sp. NBC_00588]
MFCSAHWTRPNWPTTRRSGGLDAIVDFDGRGGGLLLSISVPVHDPDGRLVAAVSVSASSSRVTVDELRDRFAPVMKVHAEALGRQL